MSDLLFCAAEVAKLARIIINALRASINALRVSHVNSRGDLSESSGTRTFLPTLPLTGPRRLEKLDSVTAVHGTESGCQHALTLLAAKNRIPSQVRRKGNK